MASHENMTLPAPRRTRKSIDPGNDMRKTMDKENATVDIGAAASAASRKKLRSKSMGPGGMDALKQGSGNRRASIAAPSNTPRSILKPSVLALADLGVMKKGTGPRKSKLPSPAEESTNSSKIALRTEEEQQAAAREREERERRDARRKSLANRRVSFAAEATLHTFHEVEYIQDSTTSTESSRRASSVANKSPAVADRQGTPFHSRTSEAPESRQSSSAPQIASQNKDDHTAASVIYSSDSEPADAVEEIDENEEEEEASSSDSDSDDGTMMTVDDVTGTTSGSHDQSSTLDEALRLAAHRAETHNLSEIEQDAEVEDDDEGEEVIPSFGWVRKANQASVAPRQSLPSSSHQASTQQEDDTGMDMDMTANSVGRILREEDSSNADEDMSIDVTVAVGGILSQVKNQGQAPVEGDQDEATMDMTTALGAIRQQQDGDAISEADDNEDMSMEMTAVMGRVLGQHGRPSLANRRKTLDQQGDNDGDETAMDMTLGVGQILSHGNEPTTGQDDGDDTMDMDLTTAIGGILNKPSHRQSSLGQNGAPQTRPGGSRRSSTSVTSTGSPRRRSLRASSHDQDQGDQTGSSNALRATNSRPETAAQRPASKSRSVSPAKRATPLASSSPMKFSPIKPTIRYAVNSSPMREATPEVRTPSPAKSPRSRQSLGRRASQPPSAKGPPVVLTPQKRRLSGQGLDREGLGSPRVAELMDRRGSIGDVATDFIPGKRTVAFEDPKMLEEEVDLERRAEEEKENGRRILQREADMGDGVGQDGSHNLREMIDAMSPKRNPLQGRKSLHVGSAQGLLGKRPAELDSDEEDSEMNDGVKRLKGHQASPVKNVRLKHPGVHGALGHSNLFSPGKLATPSFSSPVKRAAAATPQKGVSFRDANKENQTVHGVNFAEPSPKSPERLEAEVDADDDRIHLQDFLNMTSIRFMELNTTKRRHTAAPPSFKNGAVDEDDDISLEKRVLAGACTVPMLELYQHSCRELKKYISEGRRMVKEIEMDTFEENPALFREYLAATPDVKVLMDNQFKNVKSHARLLSKAMWYEWRMKLQDGLKEGLIRISEGMSADDKILSKQQNIVTSVLPALVEKHDRLAEEKENLEEAEREMADCDPTELQAARDELEDVDEDLAEKRKQIAELREQFEASELEAQELAARKESCLADIRESEKTREECRGWTSTEVNDLKFRVDAVENQHGWAVTGISNTILSLSYRREIELVFDVSSFEPNQPNSQIDLWYIADNRQTNAMPKTPEKEFFVQCIRDSIRALPQNRTKPSHILSMVKQGWDTARMVSEQIAMVNTSYPTAVSKISDTSIAVTSSLLLAPLKTRVEVTATLTDQSSPAGVDVAVTHTARVVYGETFKVDKMGEFLSTRIGEKVKHGGERWSDVIVELRDRLIARGRKA